jgi:hypothetical protein
MFPNATNWLAWNMQGRTSNSHWTSAAVAAHHDRAAETSKNHVQRMRIPACNCAKNAACRLISSGKTPLFMIYEVSLNGRSVLLFPCGASGKPPRPDAQPYPPRRNTR